MKAINFHAITLFPNYFDTFLQEGIVYQAYKKGLFNLNTINPRDFSSNHHKNVDDEPYGGGDGMVMAYEPLKKSLLSIPNYKKDKFKVISMSPQGKLWSQDKISKYLDKDIVFICARYAGLDERFTKQYVDEEISIGDYVLSGGEIPAMVIMDSLIRYIPNALGNKKSHLEDSLAKGPLLEAPQFTRPFEIDGMRVPEVLQGGDHKKIAKWKESLGILVTFKKRKDLFDKAKKEGFFKDKDIENAIKTLETMTMEEKSIMGLEGLNSQSLLTR